MKSGGLSSSAKRIQKELAEISLDPPCNCSAGPKGDNIYELAIPGRRLFPGHTLSAGLPLQAAEGGVPDADLPLQHQQQRPDLPGHPEGPVEPRTDGQQGAAVRVLAAHRPEPPGSAGRQHRAAAADRQGGARQDGGRVDAPVCAGLRPPPGAPP